MSSSDSIVQKNTCAVTGTDNKMQFPEIIDDKIDTEKFLQAARDIVRTVGMYLFSILTSNITQGTEIKLLLYDHELILF